MPQQLAFWMHRPLQHWLPGPQSELAAQALHWYATQAWPLGQMLPGQQPPWTHEPPQHFWPMPHCASPVHCWQAYCTHMSGCGQSVVVQQSPRRHLPPQHFMPLPQAASELHASPGWPFPLVPPPLLPGQVPSDAALLDARTATSSHRAAIGATYSTLAARARGREGGAFELSYLHLQTLASDVGIVPKRFEDRIQLRFYPRFRAR